MIPVNSRRPTLRELRARLSREKRSVTFLGVGPVSQTVVEATIEVSREYDCPPVFIASRNQVDKAEFGGGYLMGGMDQERFASLIEEKVGAIGYSGPVYICRDHGGPWQRDRELDERLPADSAMEIARRSFEEDIRCGFNVLHIDPTKCPHPFSLADLTRRTIELLGFCEEVRIRRGRDPIDYEIGAEDIRGGVTTRAQFEEFLTAVVAELKQQRLPLPTFIVGQTGTLTKMNHNVGRFDRRQTAGLVRAAAQHTIGFKEHNADYLSAPTCRLHPELGVGGMNVAPEFGYVETSALMSLAELEGKLVGEGWVEARDVSHLDTLLVDKSFCSAPWRKWADTEVKSLSDSEVERDRFERERIARVCGHYVYDHPEVVRAREALFENIDRFGMTRQRAREFVHDAVKASIEHYLENLGLRGVNELA